MQLYAERVIHGEIYKARPDVIAVCHHHAAAIMPFAISGEAMVPVFHLGAAMGPVVPFWDSRDDFGDTNLLVVKPEEGASLARALGKHSHGADASTWRNRGRREPARTRFPLDLFLRQCTLPRRGEAARQFRPAHSGRDRDGPGDLHAAEHPHPRVGILGDAARKARRDAGGTGRESNAEGKGGSEGQAGTEGGAGSQSEEGRAESGSREEKSRGKAARSEGKETQMNRAPLIGLALASALAAPAFAPAPLRADDTVKVAIGQINNWENQAPTLGQDAGIFKKYGLTLETFGTAGAGETLQPIISGSADIGIGVGVAGAMRAFAGGAPVRILAPAFTGSSDLFWYVRADSPIKALADATPANTVAYSTNGSSSHNLVLAFVDELGLKAKPTPTGSPPATLTAVMSGQIDIGWSAPPIGLQEVKDGRLRLIARGSDAPSLRGQTVRVTVVNANFLKQRPDVAARFVKAYRETVDWMYSRSEGRRTVCKEDRQAGRAGEADDRAVLSEGRAADRPDGRHAGHPARRGEAQIPARAARAGTGDGAGENAAAVGTPVSFVRHRRAGPATPITGHGRAI